MLSRIHHSSRLVLGVLAGLVLAVGAMAWPTAVAAQVFAKPTTPIPDVPNKIAESTGPDGIAFEIPNAKAIFEFKIDPKTPTKDLLPTPPGAQGEVTPFLGDDLTQVPEIAFQAPIEKPAGGKGNPFNLQNSENLKQLSHQVAKAKFLNQKDRDGFLKTLIANRPDLAGMSYAMGDACQMKKENLADFRLGLEVLHSSLIQADPFGAKGFLQPDALTSSLFWSTYQAEWARQDKKHLIQHPFPQEKINQAHIAGLMQVLMPESSALRQGLAKYLSLIPHAEATRALAKLAIFSQEKEVRQVAIKALQVRKEKDYAGILLAGLQYPWPTVAQRAAEALIQLECTSVVPQLVNLLDAPDPRLPVAKKVNDTEVLVANQMVRLNHHRNCMLCHAPAEKGAGMNIFGPTFNSSPIPEIVKSQEEVKGVFISKLAEPPPVVAPMPIPGEPMSGPEQGYGQMIPDILVRIDVTYLRQDFSIRQPVAKAAPWPTMQRFDFLVRTVQLTPAQAKVFQAKLQPKAGAMTPYQEALLRSLRDLTGQDAAPTAAAWKKVLKI